MLNLQRGFTLVEMIVVFAVIAVLSTVAIAAFVNYNRNQVLQIAVSELSSALNVAKSKAISQAKPPLPSCNGQILNGYKVRLDINRRSYDTYAVCSGVGEYKIAETSYLPNNVFFDPPPTSTSFFFPVIVSGVTGSGTIYLTAYGVTKTIVVDSSGFIK